MSTRRTSFDISAGPGTDIWRKPPNTDIFNAPFVPQATLALEDFVSARVTFTGSWVHRYDQGGLLLSFLSHDSNQNSTSVPPSWIKAGVEFFNGSSRISFVGCDQYADWSLHDLQPSPDKSEAVTIELKRQGDENGYALWAYQLVLDKSGNVIERYPIRECAWVYGKRPDDQVQIAACVARPAKEGLDEKDVLTVKFHELIVQGRA